MKTGYFFLLFQIAYRACHSFVKIDKLSRLFGSLSRWEKRKEYPKGKVILNTSPESQGYSQVMTPRCIYPAARLFEIC